MSNPTPDQLWGMYVMEAIGSFIILTVVQHAHVFEFSAFAISFSLFAAIVVSAKVSGAHLNGAVTTTIVLNQTRSDGIPFHPKEKIYKYMIAQIIGGTSAGFFTAMLHGPESLAKIQHNPSIHPSQAFVLEFIYTLILCLVVSVLCSNCYKHVHDPSVVGLLVAGCVFLSSMAIGDKTGGVINPCIAVSALLARGMTYGLSNELETGWLYVLAPFCAAFVAHIIYHNIMRPALKKQLPEEGNDNEMLLK